MLVIDFIHKGAPTSFVVVELGWIGVLWILWLTNSIYATKFGISAWGHSSADCINMFTSFCPQYQTAKSFSFITWIVLMNYWFLILVFSIRAHSMGNRDVWMTGVTVAEFASDNVSGPSMRHARVGGGIYP
ncbi:hypothetical protein DL93DRAFT_1786422 [Clavulina sp. PMI_390]|nr:hypothetical protein DL93DRAFT_1786422 [Clavulina sp. PMI_390]